MILSRQPQLYEAPALTPGTTNVEGSGESIRSGATIAIFDATVPVTQSHSDAATAGGGTDYSARAHSSTTQSVADNTVEAADLAAERFDTDTIHDNVTNNTRLTATTAGKYAIHGQVEWAGNATGVREIAIRLNGSTIIGINRASNLDTSTIYLEVATFWDMAATDYVELTLFQNSGGSLNAVEDGSRSVEFMMTKVLG